MDTMYFSWLDSPVDIDKDLQLPQFTLEDKILYDCSQNYTAGHLTYIYDELLGWFIGSTAIGDTPVENPVGYIPSRDTQTGMLRLIHDMSVNEKPGLAVT